MLNRCSRFFAVMIAATMLSVPAYAQIETPITIQVSAENGAPLSAISGEAQVTLRDKTSGDVMASGQTHEGKFDVSIDLLRPTPASLSVTGPLANIPSIVTSSRDILLVPGKDYSASGGIVMALPGAIVTLLTPTPDQQIQASMENDIDVTAYVIGLDGKPITAATHEVDAVVYTGSVVLGTARMTETKEPGKFLAKLKFPHEGTYIIVVSAYDSARKSAAMDQRALLVVDTNTNLKSSSPEVPKKK